MAKGRVTCFDRVDRAHVSGWICFSKDFYICQRLVIDGMREYIYGMIGQVVSTKQGRLGRQDEEKED